MGVWTRARCHNPPLNVASQSSNCSVQFNFLRASIYQVTLMVIQVVKEGSSFETNPSSLVAFMVIAFTRGA